MREILFRGKRLDNGEWLEAGTLLQNSDNERLCWMPVYGDKFGTVEDNDGNILRMEYGTLYKVDPATVGQYTGLTDKNGKRVFEGDVVRDMDGTTYPVVWGGTGFYLRYDPPRAHGMGYELLPLCYYWHAHGPIIEIIGNIHDNPELLEVNHED